MTIENAHVSHERLFYKHYFGTSRYLELLFRIITTLKIYVNLNVFFFKTNSTLLQMLLFNRILLPQRARKSVFTWWDHNQDI